MEFVGEMMNVIQNLIESAFSLTNNVTLQEWSQKIFENVEIHTENEIKSKLGI